MKKVLILTMMIFTWAAVADDSMKCLGYPTKANKSWVKASVESLSHMVLKLNLKLDIDRADEYIRVIGGLDNEADLSKPCGTTPQVKLRWISSFEATKHVSGLSSEFSAAYKICLFSVHGGVIDSVEVCAWEVGD